MGTTEFVRRMGQDFNRMVRTHLYDDPPVFEKFAIHVAREALREAMKRRASVTYDILRDESDVRDFADELCGKEGGK